MEKVEGFNKKTRVLETIVTDETLSEGPLKGKTYVLSDNISTSSILTTWSSQFLKNYKPVYDATIYTKLKNNGAKLIGKAVIGELGLDNLSMIENPYDKTKTVGGSMSGCATLVANKLVSFGIGSDVDGSIRRPAAYTGIVGFKPSYSVISRYGVYTISSSMEQVGYQTNSVLDCAILTNLLKGSDGYDMTVIDNKIDYTSNLKENVKGKKLFYFNLYNEDDYQDETTTKVIANFNLVLKMAQDLGFEVESVNFDLELLKLIKIISKIIIYAEAASNTSNLTGISFGERENKEDVLEIIRASRSKYLSSSVKRKIIMGEYFLQKDNQDKLFLNAGRIRRILVTEINKLFEKYDGLIFPTIGTIAPNKGEEESDLILNDLIYLANLGGYPSITIPSGLVNGLPVGISLMSLQLKDSLVLKMAYQLEEKLKEELNNV